MTALRFSFPMPPNLANGRHHWRALHRKRSDYYLLLDALQAANQFPRPPFRAFQKAVIHATMRLGSPMDDDNALARCKWPLDWLKTRGYVADDRKKNLVWSELPRQVIKRDGIYSVEIVLSPLTPGNE